MFKRFFMNRSLKSRITFLYTLFAVVIVGMITFYAYYFTVDLLREKEASILNDSIGYLGKQVSARIDGVNEEFIDNFENENFLRMYLKSASVKNNLAEQMKLDYDFRNYFFNIKIRNSDLIKNIYLLTSDKSSYSDEASASFEYEQFAESPYYTQCMEKKNRIQYCDLEPDSDYFSIIRSFYFLDSGEGNAAYPGVGYLSEDNDDYSALIFFLKKKYFQKLLEEEAEKRQTNILLLDENGNAVVQVGSADWLTAENCSKLVQTAKEDEFGSFEGKLENRRVNVQVKSIDLMHWDLVYVYDLNLLYRQAGQIRKVALVIFAFAVLAVFLIASFLSGTVVKPIHSLAKSMDEAVENNMEVRFQPKYNDEVADLGNRFRMLMQRVSALMTEVKQAEEQKRVEELKALQAQINPHFLYNTLDMVYWLAKMENNDNVADLIADLADFFRLSLNKGEDITSVKREVEHVTKYLEIQKVRMDGKFDYEIHVDPSVEEYKVPKLILQPFAENSLLHGFEEIDYQGHIEIEVHKEKDRVAFSIKDNGIGIGKEMLEKLNQGSYSGGESHGYAIGNVRDRILLYAGQGYGVQFDTETEQGTTVRVWFPCEF